ncbi:MAG TPA: BON domain-containing protein, partial [Novosphingobium sp.]|nr:BON domain-containing protein [Novosphingobium sp.]
MNDRTPWDEPRQERGGDDNRRNWQQNQQDWSRQQRDRFAGQPGGQQHWRQQQQDWGGGRQQGGWSEDADRDEWRRQGSYRGNEWRGERDWGNPGYRQPQQREWQGSGMDYGGGEDRGAGQHDYGYAQRAWGGSSERYGSRPTSSGSMHRDEIGETTRMRQDREMRERQDLSDRDVGGRRGQDWYSQDSGQPGSQSFAAGYGMTSGANYDQWGGPEQRRGSGQSWGHSGGSNPTFGRGYGPDYGREGSSSSGQNRGFFERAGDEIASWFGDEDAARRREQDYRGHGPSDYTRSDERIREDVNDRLTDDPRVDARRISVSVKDGEVTLSGTVGNREAKRRAEDCIDRISGVKHVQNNLRVEDRSQVSGQSGATSSWSAQEAASTSGSSNLGGGTGATTGATGGGASTLGSGSSGATGSSTSAPDAGGTGSTTGASGTSDATKTTPTSGGTSAQGASTGTMGSSGSG